MQYEKKNSKIYLKTHNGFKQEASVPMDWPYGTHLRQD